MAIHNLDPAKGALLAAEIKRLQDKVVLDKVQKLFDAVKKLGEGTHLVNEIQNKFLAFQNEYNGPFVDAIEAVRKDYEEFTDYAEYRAKLAVDTTVTSTEVGTVRPNTYDAAKNL